jgi:hypothetical protein
VQRSESCAPPVRQLFEFNLPRPRPTTLLEVRTGPVRRNNIRMLVNRAQVSLIHLAAA